MSKLTIKGQVTIPKNIRDFLGLEVGRSNVTFSIAEDGSVILRKAPEEEIPRGNPWLENRRSAELARRSGVLSILTSGFAAGG